MSDEMKISNGEPFALSRRRAKMISSNDLAAMEPLDPTRSLPLVIRTQNAQTDFLGWVRANSAIVKSKLLLHGAILFRGFSVNKPEQFRQFVEIISGSALPYRERSSPRTEIMENIYTSTDYPSDQSILPHNEHSFAIIFPQKLFFWCEIPARQGGETPLGDTRKILARIHPSVIKKFQEKGWMYVRNLTPQFGLSWQTAFQANDREQVEDYCRKSAIDWEWTAHGLRTRQVRPAIALHPETKEPVWFNHVAFFHISSVEPGLRERLLAEYEERDFPSQTYYGDGSPIEDRVVEHLREAYRNEMVPFLWESGDIALIDNILTAHARAPFVGPRRILFAMAEPYTRSDLPGLHSEAPE